MKITAKLRLDLEQAAQSKIEEILNISYMLDQIHCDTVGAGINTEVPRIIEKQLIKKIKLIKRWNNI